MSSFSPIENDSFPGMRFELNGSPKEDEIKDLLSEAEILSYPPISGYRARAIAVSSERQGVIGANIEFPGYTLNETVHAEQAAVIQAHALAWKDISSLYISAAPCGHCRQFLVELGDPKNLAIFLEDSFPQPLERLLPEYFGPSNLGNNSFLLDSATSPDQKIERLASSYSDPVISKALQAAARSYCPYTKAFGGCALALGSGEIIVGSYLESVAYNPSISPAHYAAVLLSNRTALNGGEVPRIDRVVLATGASSKVSHFNVLSRVLNSFCSRNETRVPEIEVVNF